MLLKKNYKYDDMVLILQKELNHIVGVNLDLDGIFGKQTEEAVLKFQKINGLVMDGIVGPRTMQVLNKYNGSDTATLKDVERFLSESDLEEAARELDVELASIKAFAQVESAGSGFLGDKPKILFEPHVFWRSLKKYGFKPKELQNESNYDILHQSYRDNKYVYGMKNYIKLDRGKKIHYESAVMACSWGRFQILGENWEWLGYKSVKEFEKKMMESERGQLQAFVRYILKKKGLKKALQKNDWNRVAYLYNGPAYSKYKYHIKMRNYYNEYKKVKYSKEVQA